MKIVNQPRLLPIVAVVTRSYAFAWERRNVLAAPYAIYAALTIALDLFVSHVIDSDPAISYATQALAEIFGLAFAVGIQRFVLLGEMRPGIAFFRWDRNFVQYVATTLLLVLGAAIVVILATRVGGAFGVAPGGGANSGAAAGLGLVMILVIAIAATTFARLSLTLPAAALGEPDRLQRVWQATQRNGGRLFAAAVIVVLPFLIVQLILLKLSSQDQATGEALIAGEPIWPVQILLGLISPIQLIVLTVMLALNYDALVRGGGPEGN